MQTTDYANRFTELGKYSAYRDDMGKRLEYARDNGCNTCMLTGNNEPQQNKEYLRVFSGVKFKLILSSRTSKRNVPI